MFFSNEVKFKKMVSSHICKYLVIQVSSMTVFHVANDYAFDNVN